MRRRTTPSPMQLQILELIEDSVRQTGVAPSIREIGDQVGLKSPTSVQQHLTTLERLGLIARSEGKARAIQLRSPPKANRGLPFVGNIAAGRAIAAIQQDERVDLASLFDESKHMVLRVHGESMIEDHITDGDLVVIRRQETCENGAIVAAMLDGEVTLKRFYRRKDHIELKPANAAMKPIRAKQVDVVGVMVGVIRQLAE